MKLKRISCTQFAGIRDCDVALSDGINVVFGKNESGKSTVANLISRTLFQSARIDNRRDREFKELYFPSARKGSRVTGDFADGRLTIKAPDGVYTLSKEWGNDARCTLSTPNGIIRDAQTIDSILKDILIYGEGVYSEMLLSSQRNTDIALSAILDASVDSDGKAELTEALSAAFFQSDGISCDAILQAIDAKIDEIGGKHWDIERDMPMRKAGGRWSKELGEILKAYYAYEDAAKILDNISTLESESDAAANDYSLKNEAAEAAQAILSRFAELQGKIKEANRNSADKMRLEKELAKLYEVLQLWPNYRNKLAQAKALQAEKANRELADKYAEAKKIKDEIDALSAENSAREYPSDEEILNIKKAQGGISRLENQLCGININAAVNMAGGNGIEITSLRTGEKIDIYGGNAAITEAVKVVIPNVMEMTLSPADVDIEYIKEKISAQINGINGIFKKYGVASTEELEALSNKIKTALLNIENAHARLSAALGGISYEDLESAAKSNPEPDRTRAEIDGEITDICAGADVVRFIAEKETLISGYQADYGSIEGLQATASGKKAELARVIAALKSAAEIPPEFANVGNPDNYLEQLQNGLKLKAAAREEALSRKVAAASRLDSYKENLLNDPKEEKEKAQRILNETKLMFKYWLHIKEVFEAQKQLLQNNPMQDIADSFIRYLGIISDGKITSEFNDAEKLDINIYTDNSLIDFGKLSEGSKETVSLAFRLAALDHLFPDGGGIILLDDPLTDMDVDRVAQSCELIKACAKRHQVIFLTCREEYIAMLGGNVVRV